MMLCSTASNLLLAEEVTQQHNKLTLNADLQKIDDWKKHPLILITHGTLAHNKMELISTLQELFSEQNISTLAINLSLNINNRHGFYDCATPHTHKQSDAVDEIDIWVKWLKNQGVKKIILMGHSRGGNQTAWYATQNSDAAIKKIVLIAPATWNRESSINGYRKKYNKELVPLLNKAQNLINNGNKKMRLKHTDFLYCKDTAVTAESFASYYDNNKNKDSLYLIPKIKKPLLVIAGSEDKTVRNLDKLVPPLTQKYPFKFKLIDGADHFFRDLYADELVESVTDFISD